MKSLIEGPIPELEARCSKWLEKEAFITILSTNEQTRGGELRSVGKLIKAMLKHPDEVYNVILCLTRMGAKDENEKEEKSEQLEQQNFYSPISLNLLTLKSPQTVQLMSPPPSPILISSPSLCWRLPHVSFQLLHSIYSQDLFLSYTPTELGPLIVEFIFDKLKTINNLDAQLNDCKAHLSDT